MGLLEVGMTVLGKDKSYELERSAVALVVPCTKVIPLATLNDWSAGFNWYPTYHLKLMLNAILAHPAGAGPVGVFQARMQVAY